MSEAFTQAVEGLKGLNMLRYASKDRRQRIVRKVLAAYGLGEDGRPLIPIVGKLSAATGEWADGPYTKRLRGEADRQINDSATGEVTE